MEKNYNKITTITTLCVREHSETKTEKCFANRHKRPVAQTQSDEWIGYGKRNVRGHPGPRAPSTIEPSIPLPSNPPPKGIAPAQERSRRTCVWECGGGGGGLSPPPPPRRAWIDETDRSAGVHGAHLLAMPSQRPPAGGLMLERPRATARRHNTFRQQIPNIS